MRTRTSRSALAAIKVGSPPAGTVAALALTQDHGTRLLAGTQVGLYRSAPLEGASIGGWERLAAAPIGILSLAVSPTFAQDHTVVAGTNSGIYYSRDAGETWLAAALPIAGSTVPALAFSPNAARDGVLLAGTLEDGVLCSFDRGAKWQGRSFGLLDAAVYALAFSPSYGRDETVYAGADSALYYSYNGALAWKQLPLPEEAAPVLSLALSPHFEADQTVFAGTEQHGLYRSVDRGQSWQRLDLDAASINVLLAAPEQNALIAATDIGLFLTTDQGQTWKRLLDLPNPISLASAGGLMVAGYIDQGAWITADLADWQPIDNLSTRSLLGLALSPQFHRDSIAFAFGRGDGIWRTEDGGQTWVDVSEDLPGGDVLALAVSPGFAANHAVAAATPAGVSLSQDGGLHWQVVAEGSAGRLAYSPNGQLLAAGFLDQGVRATADAGRTWTPVPGPWDGRGAVAALAVGNAGDYTVALLEGAGPTLGLWQGAAGRFERVLSRPAGPNPLVSFFIPAEPARDRPWYASVEDRVFKFSARKGRTYSEYPVAGDGQADRVLSLTGHNTPAGRVLLASTGQRLFTSTDAETWTLVHDFGSERAVALAMSPNYTQDRTVYALLLGGAFCRMVIR